MFPLAGMKNSWKNIWNNGRKWFPLAIIKLVFKKWFLLISVTVSASRKELSSKVDGFHYRGNPSPIAGMKDSLKKYVSTRRRKSLWFVLVRKSFSATRNEAFVEKYVSSIRKNYFFWQKNQKWFPLAGKYFSVKIYST